MQKVKDLIRSFLASDGVRRVMHTFWQAAAGALIAGLITAKSSSDVKLTIATAVAVGLAAVKAAVVRS